VGLVRFCGGSLITFQSQLSSYLSMLKKDTKNDKKNKNKKHQLPTITSSNRSLALS
jgi:hypothetical protein